MNQLSVKFRNGLWHIISSGLSSDYDIDVLRKTLLLNLIIFLGIIFLFIFSIAGFFAGNIVLGIVDAFMILFFMSVIYYLRMKRKYHFVGLISTIATGIFFLYLVVNGGIGQTAYLWAFTYPLIVLYLLGKRLGSYFSVLFLAFVGIVFYAGHGISFIEQYSTNMITRFLSVYAIIHIIAILNEDVRAKFHGRLTQRTDDLIETNRKLITQIKERKRIEKALRNSENFLDNVIDSIMDGITVVNADLTIRHANNVVKQQFRDKLPLNGKKCFVCFENRDLPCDACPVIGCMQSGKPEQKIALSKRGRSEKWFQVFSFPIKDRDTGEISGAVEIRRDITKTKQLEDQLARAQKMEAVGTLAGGVAHDLNNILSGIVSYPELLLMDLAADSPMRTPMETIQKSGQKAAAIVQDLLTLARRGVATNKVIDLNETIEAFLNSLEYSSIREYHPDVLFESDLQANLLHVVGSPVHLSKSIMNLLSNAMEAIVGDGNVRLATKNCYIDAPIEGYETIPEGEWVVLSVSDSGSGISSDEIHQIFEPFYTKKIMGRSGTGLGMAVVWGTVKDMKGFVDIQSSPSTGTTVHLYFPATRDHLPDKASEVSVETYMGSEKILVIDDMKVQRDIASAMLIRMGYSVTAVSSGEEALQYLAQNQADIVVLDMVMGTGMDGLDTYKAIIKRHPNQKAVIASGYSETDRVKDAQNLGAGQYLRKPYSLEKLGVAVRAELDKPMGDNCS